MSIYIIHCRHNTKLWKKILTTSGRGLKTELPQNCFNVTLHQSKEKQTSLHHIPRYNNITDAHYSWTNIVDTVSNKILKVSINTICSNSLSISVIKMRALIVKDRRG